MLLLISFIQGSIAGLLAELFHVADLASMLCPFFIRDSAYVFEEKYSETVAWCILQS